jgi:putative transcriptional regulator
MSKTYFKRRRGAQLRMSSQEKRRLDHLSDADVEAGALSDTDNPPQTTEQLRRMALAREVRLTREKLGLSQPEFAARFHIGVARLRDFEQARSEPDVIVRVFLRMIFEDPTKADRLIRLVERRALTPQPKTEGSWFPDAPVLRSPPLIPAQRALFSGTSSTAPTRGSVPAMRNNKV